MLFLHQVKVIRQGGNSSCKHLLFGSCLKAFSITCHDMLTCLLKEFMLENFRPVQVFLYFDRVSFCSKVEYYCNYILRNHVVIIRQGKCMDKSESKHENIIIGVTLIYFKKCIVKNIFCVI